MEWKEYPTKDRTKITEYLNYLSDRANGTIKTGARFMRDFVRSHPNYKFDSFVPEDVMYDMFDSD